jgi:stage V sporulation protein G
MQITEIRIKLMDDKESRNERLLAFCSVTFDHMFVVRDLKIIEGLKGLFVAMPSRKLTDRCNGCHCKNHLRARFCNQCGTRLLDERAPRDDHGRAKLHADVAHPINASSREFVQSGIIRGYHEELERAKMPGYICRYDELDAGEETVGLYESLVGMPISADARTHQPHPPRNTPLPRRAPVPAHAMAERPGFGSGVFE